MDELRKTRERPLYEADFFAWTQEQGAKLRARAHDDIDWRTRRRRSKAWGEAIDEIEHRLEVFSESCPFGIAQVMDENYLPDAVD